MISSGFEEVSSLRIYRAIAAKFTIQAIAVHTPGHSAPRPENRRLSIMPGYCAKPDSATRIRILPSGDTRTAKGRTSGLVAAAVT